MFLRPSPQPVNILYTGDSHMKPKHLPKALALSLLPVSMILANSAWAATATARPDTGYKTNGKQINIPVLTNDAGNGNKKLWTLTASSSNATITVNTSKAVPTLDYTPNTGFTGEDKFDYSFTDAQGKTASAKVYVTVANKAPNAVQDAVVVSTGQSKDIDVITPNDNDAEDGKNLTITAVTTPENGGTAEIITLASGRMGIRYTAPAVHAGSRDSFRYTIQDSWSQTATAQVTITIPNGTPAAVNDVASVEVNNLIVIDVLGNDSDPDGDTLTITKVTSPSAGTIKIVDNKLEYRAGNKPTTNPIKVTYTIEDAFGGKTTATVSITVTPDDDNPSNNN